MAAPQRTVPVESAPVMVKKGFDAICIACQTMYAYDSEQEFLEDDKHCNNGICQGNLEPLKKVGNV